VGCPHLKTAFSGLIDDARVYSAALSSDDISKLYNNSGGDLGVVANFTAPSITNQSSIPVELNFKKFGQPVVVTDFNSSDIVVSGGILTGYNNADGNITFNVSPTPGGGIVKISINGLGLGNLTEMTLYLPTLKLN
jgi:hypothetical protein